MLSFWNIIYYGFLAKTKNISIFFSTKNIWKVLIVDDDIDVHTITKLVLKDFEYQGKELS